MTRRAELEKLSPVKLYDLMLELNIPVCKREDAINKIIEIENATKTPIKAATKLKQIRTLSGISQGDLAAKTGINKRTLQAYEQGYKSIDNARIDTILKVCNALNCKFEDVIENIEYIELFNEYKKRW